MDNNIHTFPSVKTAVIYGNRGVMPWDAKHAMANMPLHNSVIERLHVHDFLYQQVKDINTAILNLQHEHSDIILAVINKVRTNISGDIVCIVPADITIMHEYIQMQCRAFCALEDDMSEVEYAVEWLKMGRTGVYTSPLLSLQMVIAQEYIRELQLSDAEMRVLRLTALPIPMIAKKLVITEGTVRNYITKLIQKIGEHERVKLLDTFHKKLHKKVQQQTQQQHITS